MLDIHTHILPGMDDGSRDAAQSAAMLAQEAQQGVHTVVLSSHFYPDRESPERFVQRRNAAEQTLRAHLAGMEGMPELLPGAEVAFFDSMCRADALDLLCIGDTRAMLIEMPFCRWTSRMLGELEELRRLRGIQPVLAHVERYMAFQPAGIFREMGENGMLLQVNASFILRWQTRMKALSMLKRQEVHFVASDCHDLLRRPPELGLALEKVERKLGAETMAFLRSNQEMLLGGMG